MGDDTNGSSWGDWTQKVFGGLIEKAADAKWVQPYNIEQMRLQALGPLGYYQEGQRNPTTPQTQGNIMYGMNQQTMLVIGAAVVVGLLLMRK